MNDLLTSLIQFQTTKDNPPAIDKCLDYLKSFFNDYPFYQKEFESNGHKSLIISTTASKSPKIILNGHLDVVPGPEKIFKPKIKGSKIYGRGSADMKGNVTAMIFAFIEAYEQNKNLDMALMLTTDEEIGGFDGVNYLLNQQNYSCEVAFVPDQGTHWQICTDEKAVWHIKVTAQGRSAHGSRPWLGDNAVNKCWKTYMDIRDKFRERWGRLSAEDRWKPTINLGSLHGGDAANKVPDYAEMLLDIRFPASVKQEEIAKIIKECSEFRGTQVEFKIQSPASHTDLDNLYVKLWKDIVENKYKKITEYYQSDGGSDGRFFSYKGIPVVMTSPNMSAVHIDDEWIDLDDLEIFKNATRDWLLEISK